MNYMSAQEAADKWGITKRRVQHLCASNRITNATRIGNMWVIPSNAQKPSDSRYKSKNKSDNSQSKNNLKTARNRIKSISVKSMNILLESNYSFEHAKKILVSAFLYGLLCDYSSDSKTEKKILENKITELVYKTTEIHINDIISFDEIYKEINNFISEFPSFCDDALAWCYQFANKVKPDSSYSNTQFFTEKYMITSIIDSIDVVDRKRILDPACGGGNFLLYSIDSLCNKTNFPRNDKSSCVKGIQAILNKHYGYEIDTTLAMVASINLRLECISILKNLGYQISAGDFTLFTPNIYAPISKTIGGALDVGIKTQVVKKIGTDETVNIDDIIENIDVLITNPPFQTIKGMDADLKQYLKENYPLSKCDMCNAFIELSKRVLSNGGIAGMVTQNSWMYLDSFIDFRIKYLSAYSFEKIIELGSNAFFDLSGEKSNVALVIFKSLEPSDEQTIQLSSLKGLNIKKTEEALYNVNNEEYTKVILQKDVRNNFEARFDMISTSNLKNLLSTSEKYDEFAVPMQGTSTGNAKELIDYFWKHLRDPNWTLVSKGGGYSRWLGLNHYCVKWGSNGEYIKEQKGSAIRNANYFDQTQMVFSDTGTAGLNVRELQKNQIFIASGPGIRIKAGNPYSHLAFLNSRFASYYIRLISPKLTIAAGYIAKIPVCLSLLDSAELKKLAKKCLKAKKSRLSKRPFNREFCYCDFFEDLSIEEQAYQWFLSDIQDEWEQLKQEYYIDEIVFSAMKLTSNDIETINNYIGEKHIFAETVNEQISFDVLSNDFVNAIDSNCNIVRTKAERNNLGCDGILEYLSQKLNVSCEAIYKYITKTQFYPEKIKSAYENLLIHSVLMSKLDYLNTESSTSMSVLINSLSKAKGFDESKFRNWIIENFNFVHSKCFCENPMFVYNPTSDEFEIIKENSNG